MTDEAADPRRPASGSGRPDGPDGTDRDRTAEVPVPEQLPHPPGQRSGPPGGDPDSPGGEPGRTGWSASAADPGPAGPGTGIPGAPGYGPAGPPPGAASFTSRYGLVRPRQGRYLAGVCAAIGRATNTDPILWRVLLAVLGFFGGIGIVVYVAAWLFIPAEGDTASPVESMLGRGRSSMSPILVIVLCILVAVLFGYIVTDVSRAVLLGAAILIGGALLLNRNAATTSGRTGSAPPAGPPGPTGPPGPAPASDAAWSTPYPPYPGSAPAAPGHPTAPGAATGAPVPTYPVSADQPIPPESAPPAATTAGADPAAGYPSWYRPTSPAYSGGGRPGGAYPAQQGSPFGAGYPADQPTQPLPPSPAAGAATGAPPAAADTWPTPPVAGSTLPPAPTAAGYRPPFAPHGPYASAGLRPPGATPPVQGQKRPKPPKPPRERSSLGAATFSLIFVAIGVVAILDLVNAVPVRPSTYFAAVLITIALGLLVGAWFGRARWLIALGLVAAAALGISTLAESYQVEQARSPVVWRPASHDALAVRYQTRFGDATLDLRQVDFTGKSTEVTVRVNFGKLRVIVPPEVDTTVVSEIDAGDARIFGNRSSGVDRQSREVTDLGPDGSGGGTLRLLLHVIAGDVEVTR